jgi:molybdenum cofactor cytidylyltransferase
MKEQKVVGVILAAGFSKRMNDFKPLLTLYGKTFLHLTIAKLLLICWKVVVVLGHRSDVVIDHLVKISLFDRINIVVNPYYKKGMFFSLQKGLFECMDADWILYHFVDQPNLPQNFYSEFLNQTDRQFDWIQPAYKKRKGHPILFNEKMQKKIIAANPYSNLRSLTREGLNKKIWNCKYDEILTDIDTPHDYNSLKN